MNNPPAKLGVSSGGFYDRESFMMREMEPIEYPNLEPLFHPRALAIIGASDDTMKPAGLPIKYALHRKYQGKLFPVNPNRETIQGLKAYSRIADIPEDVDVCLIMVPAVMVPDAVQQCADKGVKVVVVGASGFAEFNEEGKKRQDEIIEIAKRSGMRICGPNSSGLCNVHEGISVGYGWSQEVVIPGRLGCVFQSGALLSSIVCRFAQKDIGMSYFVNSGNQADIETFDYVRYMMDDPNTDVIAAYVEGFKNPAKFLNVAELALEREKPMVILKMGRSALATRVAKGHTGSLVGSDAVFDAICKQKGIARADDFNTLIAICSVFLKCKTTRGDGIGVISSSGAAMGLIADHAMKFSLRFPDLSTMTKEKAAKVIPAYGEMKNPFDIAWAGATATQKIELARAAVQLMLNDENIDILLAVVNPMDRRATQNYVQALVEGSMSTNKPIIMFCPSGSLREEEQEIFAGSDIPILMDSAECVYSLSSLIRFSQALKRHKESREAPEHEISFTARDVKKSLNLPGKTLTEHESKLLLSSYGIPITEEAVCKSCEEAVQIANKIRYPVVLKIDSPDILHATDAGAIKLNINNQIDLIAAYNEVVANSKKYNPKAEIRGVLVQEMVKGGREVIVGMSHDPQFGPTIMFGLGGVFVEVIKDISLRVAPLTRHDAEEMVREIKGYRILEAFRGTQEADIEAIIDVLLKLSRLSMCVGDAISEIDINPLMVLDKGKGVKVVDALVVPKM